MRALLDALARGQAQRRQRALLTTAGVVATEAFTLFSRAIAMWERTVDPQHPDLGLGYARLGQIEEARGHPREAMAAYERAVAIFEHHEGLQRFEPRSELALAKLLVEHGGDRARALELARTAREGWLTLGPSFAGEIAALDAWLTGLPNPRGDEDAG